MKKHLTVNKTVELLRKEQGMMEVKLLKAINGEDVARIQKGARLTKDSNIKRIVNSYKSAHISEHLTGLASNMGDVNELIVYIKKFNKLKKTKEQSHRNIHFFK